MNQSRQNLEKWLKTHLLPQNFPNLAPIPEDKMASGLFLRDEGREINRILEVIVGSPRTMIICPQGQGISTTISELSRKTRKADVRVPHLFVVIDPQVCYDSDDFAEKMSELIRNSIFEQLIIGYWQETFYGTKKQKLLQLMNVAREDELTDLAYDLLTANADNDKKKKAMDKIHSIAESYENRLDELYKYLHSQLGLATFLIFDFAHTANEDVVMETFREIKWFDENEKGDNFPVAAFNEVYFLTETQAASAQTSWQRDYHKFIIPPFNEAEIFAILSAHYQPFSGGKPVPLGSVFSQDFVKLVWQEGRPLKEMTKDMRTEILKALDIPYGHVQYLLTPNQK